MNTHLLVAVPILFLLSTSTASEPRPSPLPGRTVPGLERADLDALSALPVILPRMQGVPACKHCKRLPTATTDLSNPGSCCITSKFILAKIDNGHDGQCIDGGCSHVYCKWKGCVEVTNNCTYDVSVNVKYGGLSISGGSQNVPKSGGQKSFPLSLDASKQNCQDTPNCLDLEVTFPSGGCTQTQKLTFECPACVQI